jgi:NAD(P)-dependent dehydrogenase (short-subunit alcohol dehydrogenase family)
MAKTFGAESTADEVLEGIDLSGKRVLITGVSAGLGVETARSLVEHGATVVGTARDLTKARRALADAFPQKSGAPPVDLVEMDLASLSSVRKAASELLARGKTFDVIIANAGVMACPQGKTQDGFETQFGTNHLGHFVFVNRLVPLLKRGSRIVTLSSAGHQDGEHSVRGGPRQQAQGSRRARYVDSSRRNSDRARPASHARTHRADDGTSEQGCERPGAGVQVQDGAARRGDVGLERLCRISGCRWRALLRRLSRLRAERRHDLARRCALIRSQPGARERPVAQERRDGWRALPTVESFHA